MYIFAHPELIFFFFSFPILGWILQAGLPTKIISYVLYTSLVLLLPIFTGYSYIIENLYAILVYTILACGYGLLLKGAKRKILTSILLSIVLVFPLGFIAFIGAMAGTITVEQHWEIKDYRVDYVRDQGFSGGPLLTYRLKKYGFIPIFIKEVDSKVDNDTTNNCTVKFQYKNVSFNKCN
ncbi:hypothetical protein BEL04_09645 [Mucilaginibacter sp. PPCGB 2223]|uniref:hypothetical protein n=1 Tax=Mucilaginibacter sp. PPCGB 2223 TaxID=1886027 RepID=UPI0008266A65|nr:hypothetical protein [Mucilaginibacter sp. PPCGB 2223]OCX54492.1 hypothetical protein BEL04_09645 [Mucilaginibacter sp. PPCGB 2223]